MQNLKEQIIHLQHKLASISRGESVEVGSIRIHRYDRDVAVWDLTNAGKRGKMVDSFVLYDLNRSNNELDLMEELEKANSFESALKIAKKYLEKDDNIKLYERKHKGIEISPAGFKPISIQGKDVFIQADYDSFRVRDRSDINEETCIPAIKGGKADIKVFYRWVKDNQAKIKNMNFNEIVSAMRDEGIKYHRYCALD
jgi:hypothetical protein